MVREKSVGLVIFNNITIENHYHLKIIIIYLDKRQYFDYTQSMSTKITTKKKTRGFKKGVSGNPSGRPKGVKNKSTLIKEAIENNMVEAVEGRALAVLEKTVEMALAGDTTCLKMLMDRMWVPGRAKDDLKGLDKSQVIINVTTIPGEKTILEGEVVDDAEKSS